MLSPGQHLAKPGGRAERSLRDMVGQEEFPGLHFWGTPGVRVRSEGVLEFDVSPSLLPSLSPSISSINNFLNKHLLHVRESMLLMCERCMNQGSHAPRACGGCSGDVTCGLGESMQRMSLTR